MREEGTIAITVLQMRKLRHREIERLAQVPIGNKPSGRDASLRTAALESVLNTTLFFSLSKSSPGELLERYLDGSLDVAVTPRPSPLGPSWNGGSVTFCAQAAPLLGRKAARVGGGGVGSR